MMDGFSKDGRKLRPRRTTGSAVRSEKVDFQTQTEDYGRPRSERRPYGSNPYSERSSYGENRSHGEASSRSSYGSSRREGGSYGEASRGSYGEHRSSYGSNARNGYGERQERSGYGERQERGSYGERSGYGEHRQYSNGSRSEGGYHSRSEGEGRSYGKRQAGAHRSYGEGSRGSYGERSSYGNGERGSCGGSRSQGAKPYKGAKGGGKKGRKPAFSKQSEEGINRMISRRPLVHNDYDGPAYEEEIKNEVRLNRFIANSGVCSRREADTFIQAGCVTVNGEVVTELGTKVNIFDDDVRFNGERLKGESKVYMVMNKPKGYVTSASDPHAGKTVMNLIKNCPSRVYPVGRLDKATTGVLMFTNDGEIAERLTHPSYDKKKIYQVALDRSLSQEDFDRILEGITLGDGFVKADELEFVDEGDHSKLGIEIHSGKNRIVRRIFESLGYSVKALDRVYFAGLTKKGLKKGEWRYLSESEVNMLKMGAYV